MMTNRKMKKKKKKTYEKKTLNQNVIVLISFDQRVIYTEYYYTFDYFEFPYNTLMIGILKYFGQ